MSEPPVPTPGSAPGRRDRWFGPAVLAGLGGAALAAVAGSRDWATARGDAAGVPVEESVSGAESQPLVASLALVALASWGVLLVVRGRVRRAVAAVGLIASMSAVVAVVAGFVGVQDDALDAAIARGATGDTFVTSLSAWYYLAGVGATLASLSLVVALLRSPGWPAMGSRYDAPAARATEDTDQDMWRAMDEGRDPTS